MTTTDRPATTCEAFQRTASIDPDAVALRTPGGIQTLTWREYAQVLTHTRKLKRKPITAKYAAEIEDLCASDLHHEVHEPTETATAQPA